MTMAYASPMGQFAEAGLRPAGASDRAWLTPTGGGTLAAPAATAKAALPFTGAHAAALSLLAFVMTAAGIGLCVAARQRRGPSRR
ncbi:hypothetical protein J4573_23605 [Actinomadura barringtoniae]|uniref:LPXTG cell wall anchor domain-containing protein n=1 Tax=Actinomadura barringtoniae TaxID=1427535 RepID=A0A939PJ27_9ACTN|nr:hypothetical protein [Actinomadura barringtoniae]MBO2450109.1 hypothetical protein [Actinomadura barringtoniae]